MLNRLSLSNPINLASGRLLARNSILNLAGEVAPFFVALVALPVIIGALGVDRYGVLTLSMLVVGYFGLFDFGLGRAATKFIAEAASSEQRKIPGLFWTSLFMMLTFGAAAGVVLAGLAPWLVRGVLKIPVAFQLESLHAFYLLALSMPFVISGGSLRGTLSAFQRFDLINTVRVPSGIFSYVGPLSVLPFSHSLGWLVAVMVAGRLAGWLATLWLCLRVVPALRREIRPRRATIRPMLNFGGWVAVSGIAIQIMEYADRFIIGAMLSVAAVAYYAVPYQVTNKLRVIPGALSGVVFPALSGSFVANPGRAAVLFERATRYILLAVFPPVLLVVTLAPDGLALWLGPSFAGHSAAVMRWLGIGMFVNSLCWTPDALVEAAHRPDLTAKMRLVTGPVYLLVLWWMLPRYGVEGAAITWALRSALELLVLFAMARVLLPNLARGVVRIAKLALVALLVVVIGMLPMTLPTKGVFLATMLGLYALSCWRVLLEPEEKEFVRGHLRTARVFVIGAAE